jgi:TolB-like protein/pimeloyl-ACP methyl ester carboxylesterase/cytochrome c-type biogenesis protein CcmH/NrfG/predicted Ser/Thr protein kinase
MIGKTISHYKILDKLGQGGMGEVYLAEDNRLHRKVALKFLPSSTASDPDARERLLREARAASKLHHPNIVTIHSIEEQDGRDFIVMEYIEGVPITQYVSEHQLSSVDLNVTLRQLCDGLHHAHASGVVHRDLKPDNILVEADGRVRIMDFGVAILSGTPRLTQAGSMVGTTAYVSPEQVRGQDADERSDLFSLGVLMYQLVTGKHPFTGAHEAATLYSIAHEQPPAVTKLVPDIAEDFAGVIQKCLSKDPADRYASAGELSKVLTDAPAQIATAIPETKYAKSGTTNIAYQVFGEGKIDLVLVMGFVSHVELIWQDRYATAMLNRLGKHFRVIIFDKRGTGLSDRVAELPPLEQRMDDVRAVMDAAKSERAVLFGISEGGPMCMLFAATYPDRTRGLISYGSYPVRISDEKCPWGPTWEERGEEIAQVEQYWGGSLDLADLVPSLSGDTAYMKWLATYLRQSASPGAAAALLRMNSQVDIRSILPNIRVPSLILHRKGDRDVPFEGGRYIAERIPGAEFVELEGDDHLPWAGDMDSVLQPLENFARQIDSPIPIETRLLTAMRIGSGGADSENFRATLHSALKSFNPLSIQFDGDGATALFDGSIRSLKAAEQLGSLLNQTGKNWSIGLHSGECPLSGSAAGSTAVKVASQVAKQGMGSGIRLTSTVQELVAEAGMSFVEVGSINVPGIDFTWRLVELPLTGTKAEVASFTPSIAVLPFANMSADPENEYFSDGLTEELLNVLAKNPELKVTGRTSSFAFKGKLEDLRGIGQKLGVETLLEGSVRKSGNRVRISAQLVKASDGFHLWSETYDRVLEDIFAVQDDIAKAVSSALNVTLLGQVSGAHQTNAETYNLLLQANHFASRNSGEDLRNAARLYKEVLALDPDNARALAGWSHATGDLAAQGFADHSKELPGILAAAEKALSIDDSEPRAHATMGWVRFLFELDYDAARHHLERAHQLAPGDSSALLALASLEYCDGHFVRARGLLEKSVELDPLNARAHREMGRMYVAAGDLEQAIRSYRKSLELSPGMVVAHAFIALTYMTMGELTKAIEEAKKEKAAGYRYWAQGIVYHAAGMTDESDRALKELIEGSDGGEHWATQIANVHAYRNEMDEAFKWLHKAFEIGDTGLSLFRVAPGFDCVRSDPRYPDLLRKMGLKPLAK